MNDGLVLFLVVFTVVYIGGVVITGLTLISTRDFRKDQTILKDSFLWFLLLLEVFLS